jgi:hypothetical protein
VSGMHSRIEIAEHQFDLFADAVPQRRLPASSAVETRPVDVTILSDDDLLERLRQTGVSEYRCLVHEVTRRKLSSAIPALEALILRHAGFGKDRVIPEQAAAIEALVAVGGRAAAEVVGRLLARRAIEGPGLELALDAAARLRTHLREDIVIGFLRHDNPVIRAAAARCAPIWPKLAPILSELIDDLHREVSIAAACALGRMGRSVARPVLLRALREAPSEDVIDAAAGIGDEEFIVLLGRIAVAHQELAQSVLDALDAIDHPRAKRVAAGIPRTS